MGLVYFRNYGCLYMVDIVSLPSLSYVLPPKYNSNVPYMLGYQAVLLYARGKIDAAQCFRKRNIDSHEYILDAAVYGEWKHKLNQGIIFTTSTKNITQYVSPSKPILFNDEINSCFNILLGLNDTDGMVIG